MGSDTIKKCFRKSGILQNDFLLVCRMGSPGNDPFDDIDDFISEDNDLSGLDSELTDLIKGVLGDGEYCSAQELISAESDLPVCPEFADDTWEEDFMADLDPHTKTQNTESDSDSDIDEDQEDITENEEPAPRIKTFHEAITCLEHVRSFLECRGYTSEATDTDIVVNSVVRLQCLAAAQSVQTSLTDYFPLVDEQ